MSTRQLQAGYILDSVRNRLSRTQFAEKDNLDKLLRSLCYFDIAITSSERPPIAKTIPSEISVADNLVSRGLPTRPSLFVEEHYVKLLKSCNFNVSIDPEAKRIGSLLYELACDSRFAEMIIRAFHVIDPEITGTDIFRAIDRSESTPYDSVEEKLFHREGLGQILPTWWIQLLERQRPLTAILKNCSPGTLQSDSSFIDQRVDFSIEFPYPFEGVNGIVFEVDGAQHQERENAYLDKKRDRALQRSGIIVYRIPASESGTPGKYLDIAFLDHLSRGPYLKTLAQNYEHPLDEIPDGKLALSVALGPFLCARIQKAILYLIKEGFLSLASPKWKIAIVEHNIDCAELAIKDLERLIESLGALSGSSGLLPVIELSVFTTSSYVTDNAVEYDALIDCAILERSFIAEPSDRIKAKTRIEIRSTNSIRSTRLFSMGPNITYQPLGITERSEDDAEAFRPDPEKLDYLKNLLRDIFRKDDFRPGQIEIINRALQNRSVIGLLPTGSGKSLTYQLAALLQPGIAAVVDPLKSLMVDQCNSLLKNQIDCIAYINSSLSAAERNEAMEKIRRGQVLLAFISPERLQVKDFRDELFSATEEYGKSFSYCVVDEAHCVSEWGHDFRTSYLQLGQNGRRFCKSKGRDEVTFIALTATASYDVLADIQRELDIEDEGAIIRLADLSRNELSFEVREVKVPSVHGSDYEVRQTVGTAKSRVLEAELMEYNPAFNPTIVFCPHRTGTFGAESIQPNIPDCTIGRYSGTSGSKDVHQHELRNATVQEGFINNKIDLLFATKAFGMGIDKPNIRHVIHLNYPSSIEGYYQEAGRAGRDKRDALCTILYCNQSFPALSNQTCDSSLMRSFYSNSFKGPDFEKTQLFELLNKIVYPRSTIDAPQKISDGIERVLEGIGLGEQAAIDIPFENDAIVGIASIFNTNGIALSISDIRKQAGYCYSLDEFSEKLEKLAKKNSPHVDYTRPLEQIAKKRMLYRIRDDQSTFKAVYRLSLLGVIDDYHVDYKAKLIVATITRHEDNYYQSQLKTYLSKYYAAEKVEAIIDTLPERKGKSLIQKCLNVLVEFVYREIAEQRKEAISAMEEACKIGLSSGGDHFEEFIMLYMNSRYARREYLPRDTDNGLSESFDIVEKYVKLVHEDQGGEINNLKHLRGAATFLLAQRPDNYVFLLLKAFSTLILEKNNPELIDSALSDYLKGMRKMAQESALSAKGVRPAAVRFREFVASFDSDAAESLSKAEAPVIHSVHLEWLKHFNEEMLGIESK